LHDPARGPRVRGGPPRRAHEPARRPRGGAGARHRGGRAHSRHYAAGASGSRARRVHHRRAAAASAARGEEDGVSVETAVVSGLRRYHLTLPRVLFGAGLFVPLVFSRVFGEYGNTIAVNIAVAAMAVAGLHVLVQWAGQISLAQVAFMGVGAFA